MRNIKFRAFNYADGEMVYLTFGDLFVDTSLLKNGPYEIMLHSGLTNNHQQEIYEGDILCAVAFDTHVDDGIVIFETGVFQVQAVHRPAWKVPLFDALYAEVLGNICENGKLLF